MAAVTEQELQVAEKFARQHFGGDPPLPSSVKLAQKILMAKRWNLERAETLLQSFNVCFVPVDFEIVVIVVNNNGF